MSLSRLNRRFRTLADRLENNTATLSKQVGLAIIKSVVRNTPVDEAVARSNWRLRYGRRPSRTVAPAFAPGMKLGRQERTNEAFVVAAARGRLRATPVNRAARQTLFIINPVKYLPLLNAGSSKQQAAGFVERGANVGRRRAKKGITLKRKVNFK